jgi:hypothetical protein
MLRLLRSTKGATLVEFSLILMLFLILVFGIIEFSIALFNKQVITNACREGARVGIIMRAGTGTPALRNVEEENGIIKNRVIEFAKNHLVSFDGNKMVLNDVKILPEKRDLSGTTFGNELRVEASFKYTFLFLSIMLDPVNLNSVSTMRME